MERFTETLQARGINIIDAPGILCMPNGEEIKVQYYERPMEETEDLRWPVPLLSNSKKLNRKMLRSICNALQISPSIFGAKV